jgi:hypothetical protein
MMRGTRISPLLSAPFEVPGHRTVRLSLSRLAFAGSVMAVAAICR